jgi:hypothetical protein
VFGDHCIANAVETSTQNNNRCPLCRAKLFEQEDYDENGDWIYDSDEVPDDVEEQEVEGDEEEESTESEAKESDQVEGGGLISFDDADKTSASKYFPSDENVDIDHKQDEQWQAKLTRGCRSAQGR